MELKTVGEIARIFEVPTHRVKYAIESYRILETQRAGILRLYDLATVERIGRALNRIGGRGNRAN